MTVHEIAGVETIIVHEITGVGHCDTSDPVFPAWVDTDRHREKVGVRVLQGFFFLLPACFYCHCCQQPL